MRRVLCALFLLFLTSSSQAAGLSVEGQVLGPDGQALAGARVELRPVLRVYEQGIREVEGRGEPEVVARIVTNSDGWYRLQVPREGAWRVTITADGFVPMDSRPMIVFGENALEAVRMEADAGLTVRVEDAEGRPLAGARVAAAATSLRSSSWQPARRAGTTGADGSLRLPRAGKEALRLSALGPWHRVRRITTADAGLAVLRLERGRRFMIEIVDDGKLVPESFVRDEESGLLIGRTGAKGSFIADTLPDQTWKIRVETRDGRLALFDVPGQLRADARIRRRLLLVPAVPVVGRVVDQATGKPVQGARAWPKADPAAFVVTDASGSYHLPVWASHNWVWMCATAEGHFMAQEPFLPKSPQSVPPTLALRPAGSLAGVAVEEAGKPVPDAAIRVYLQGLAELREILRTRTSPQGSFRISYLTPGESYDLLAVRSGLAPAYASVTLPEHARTVPEIHLTLGPVRSAIGRVVDSEGQPVAGAEVKLVRNLAAETRSRLSDEALADDGLYRAETGSDGGFRVLDLPVGWFDLEVRRSGFVPSTTPGVELRADVPVADLGTLVLDRGVRIEGRVTEPGGAPVAGAEVWTIPDGMARERAMKAYREAGPAAVTDQNGYFLAEGLLPLHALPLHICRPGYLTASFWQEDLPEAPVEIKLLRAARRSGRVLDPEGQPIPGAQVHASLVGASFGDFFPPTSPCPQDGRRSSAETDAEGRFTLEPLEGGLFEVWASAEGYLASERQEEVEAGQEGSGPTLVLERGSVLTGTVLQAGGAPALGATVGTDGQRSAPRAVTDGDGRFRLNGVEPGSREVRASHPEHGYASRMAEVTEGENRLDLRLKGQEHRWVSGRVVGPDREPVEGALVEIEGDRINPRAAQTAADGSFSLEVDEDGFTLLARKPGYAPTRLDHWAAAGRTEGLEIRLDKAASLSGRIVGVAPEDLHRVEVTAMDDRSFLRQGMVSGDGTYRILDLRAGEWIVTALLGDRSIDAQAGIVAGDENRVVDLTFPPTFEVRGRVVGAGGEPIENARVTFASSDDTETAYTRDDGSFSLEVPEGTYALLAEKEGSSLSRAKQLVTVSGGPVDGLEIRLSQGAVLSGHLLGLPPEDIPSVSVQVDEAGYQHSGKVAPDGTYRIPDLGLGDWTITARFGVEKVSRKVTIHPGQEAVELDLPFELGDLTLSGRVTGYRELDGGHVELGPPGDWFSNRTFQAPLEAGAFRLLHLRPGRYLLTVEDDRNKAVYRQEIDLTASRELVIDLGGTP